MTDKTAREFQTAISSKDWMVVRKALDELDRGLARGDFGAEEVLREAETHVLELAGQDTKWEVKEILARILRHVRHDDAVAVLGRLTRDTSSWVKDAAQASLEARTRARRADAVKEGHATVLQQARSAFEARFGQAAWRAAVRLAEQHGEQIVNELYHEVMRGVRTVDTALRNVDAELGGKVPRKKCRKQTLVAIRKNASLQKLMDDMRRLTKGVRVEITKVGLRAVIRESLEQVKVPAKAQADLTLDVPKIEIEADRGHLIHAFANLLENALNAYGERAGPFPLRVRARVEGSWVTITFADDGCGMSADDLKGVFKYRAPDMRRGTGFGLRWTQHLIESAHGGRLRLSSKVGAGTTVTVELPVDQGDRA